MSSSFDLDLPVGALYIHVLIYTGIHIFTQIFADGKLFLRLYVQVCKSENEY